MSVIVYNVSLLTFEQKCKVIEWLENKYDAQYNFGKSVNTIHNALYIGVKRSIAGDMVLTTDRHDIYPFTDAKVSQYSFDVFHIGEL